MENVPENILAEIFGYLPHSEVLRCSLVCKKWKSIVRQQRFFGSLNVAKLKDDKWLELETIFNEANIFPFRKITANTKDFIPQTFMERVYKLCKGESIRYLDLTLDSKTFELNIEWINKFRHIEYLTINSVFKCSTIYTGALWMIMPMESVRILESNYLHFIERIIPKLPNLQRICYYRICRYPYYENVNRIQAIAENVPKLEIIIFLCDLDNLANLIEVAKPNIKVQEIMIPVNQLNTLQNFCQTYSTVQELTLKLNDHLTSTTFIEIANSAPNLQALKIYDINEWPIEYVLDDLAPCEKLWSLKLTFKAGGEHQLKFVKKVTSFPYLRKLNIKGNAAIEINDTEFEKAMMSCTKLDKLNFHCSLTDSQVQSIMNNLKILKSLYLSKASNAGLRNLRSLRFLKKLTIGNGESLTDDTLINEFKLRRLETLYMYECNSLTKAGIKAIAKGCPFIKWFEFHGALTDACITFIGDDLKYLKRFNWNPVSRKITVKTIKENQDKS